MIDLKSRIERSFSDSTIDLTSSMAAFAELRDSLENGAIRPAEPDPASPTGWRVNAWVKQGILLGFLLGQPAASGTDLSFVDKDTYPVRKFAPEQGIRIVPGGSSVRSGAYLAKSVVCMPPMYVNVGAYIDEGTMVD